MARGPQHLPVYRQLANQIIDRIKSGELQPGDRTPSARELMESAGIHSATAARVLAVLRDEGWADTIPGRGTIVRTQTKLTQGADRLSMLRSGGSGLNEGERVEILPGRSEPASQDVADALGVEAGEEVAMRRRRYIDDVGVSTVSTTWITGVLAAELPEFLAAEPLPKMTFGLIEERTGRRATRQRDSYFVVPAPGEIADLLGVQAGKEVLVVANRYEDQHGDPTEYAVDYHAPGRALVKEVEIS